MTQNTNLSYQNPKDGKMPMLLGILSGIAGTGAVGAGLVGRILEGASSVGVNIHSEGAYFVRENAKQLITIGAGAVVCGAVLYGFGRLQHWYSNKVY